VLHYAVGMAHQRQQSCVLRLLRNQSPHFVAAWVFLVPVCRLAAFRHPVTRMASSYVLQPQ
jgi:hypothetical protein